MAGVNARKVNFSKIDCCSLGQAFTMNTSLVSAWLKIIPVERIKLLAGILQNTVKMDFTPSDEIAGIYKSFVEAGLDTLRDDVNLRYSCGHSREQHLQTLLDLKTRLEVVVSVNH